MTEPRPDRIACRVPFCRCTAPRAKFPDCERIICGKHWRLGDARPRRVYRKALKKYERYGDMAMLALAHRCWEKVLVQAIERSAGITK